MRRIIRAWGFVCLQVILSAFSITAEASYYLPPQDSRRMTLITNLDPNAPSFTTATLWRQWHGDEIPSISPMSYEYQAGVVVPDQLKNTHNVIVYYDLHSGSSWEYIITCNSSEDQRSFATETSNAGLLANGIITFNLNGKIMNFTMSLLTGFDTWIDIMPNSNGYYEFIVDFLGGENGGTEFNIEFDIGTRYYENLGTFVNDPLTTTQYATASTTIFSQYYDPVPIPGAIWLLCSGIFFYFILNERKGSGLNIQQC